MTKYLILILLSVFMAGTASAGQFGVSTYYYGDSRVTTIKFGTGRSIDDWSAPTATCPNMSVNFFQATAAEVTMYLVDPDERNTVALVKGGTAVSGLGTGTTASAVSVASGKQYYSFVVDTAETDGESLATVTCSTSLGSSGGGGAGAGAIADLPGSPSVGDLFQVSDNPSGDCNTALTAGFTLCMYTGVAWVAAGTAAGDNLGVGGAPTGNIDMGILDITFSSGDITFSGAGTVDGRDVSADWTTLNAHVPTADDLSDNDAGDLPSTDTALTNAGGTGDGFVQGFLDGIVALFEAETVVSHLVDTNADGDYGPELATLFDTLAQQPAVADGVPLVIQLPCGNVTIQDTVVLENSVANNVRGITIRGCGFGRSSQANPRAGTEIKWSGADGGTMFQVGGCANYYDTGGPPQTSGSPDAFCDSDGTTQDDSVGNLNFEDFAVDADVDDAGTQFADTAFIFVSQGQQHINFNRVSYHDFTGATIMIGPGTSVENQMDTMSFNDNMWELVSTCIQNSAANALHIKVDGGRCRYNGIGFDIVSGDINLNNMLAEGPSPATACIKLSAGWRVSQMTNSTCETAGEGLVATDPDGTAQAFTMTGSRISTSGVDQNLINWTDGGYLTVTGSKFAGTSGVTTANILIDVAAGAGTQELKLGWFNNFVSASSVDSIIIDYDGGANADIIASGGTIFMETAGECADGSRVAHDGSYVNGTICTDGAGAQTFCDSTDSTCANTGWTAVAGGAGGGISNIVEDVTPQLGADVDAQGYGFNSTGEIFQNEAANADADVAGEGQWWVKNDVPNVAMFTDDAGTDWRLSGDEHFYTKNYLTSTASGGLIEAVTACEATSDGGVVVVHGSGTVTVTQTGGTNLVPNLTKCSIRGYGSETTRVDGSPFVEGASVFSVIDAPTSGFFLNITDNDIFVRDIGIVMTPEGVPPDNEWGAIAIVQDPTSLGSNVTPLNAVTVAHVNLATTIAVTTPSTGTGVWIEDLEESGLHHITSQHFGDGAALAGAVTSTSISDSTFRKNGFTGLSCPAYAVAGRLVLSNNIYEANPIGFHIKNNCPMGFSDIGGHFEGSTAGTPSTTNHLLIESRTAHWAGLRTVFFGVMSPGEDITRTAGFPTLTGPDICRDCQFTEGITYSTAADDHASMIIDNMQEIGGALDQTFTSTAGTLNNYIYQGYDYVATDDCTDLYDTGTFILGARCLNLSDNSEWLCDPATGGRCDTAGDIVRIPSLTANYAWTGTHTFDEVFVNEGAAAAADVAGDGQWWVKNDATGSNMGMFTGEQGIDTVVSGGQTFYAVNYDSDASVTGGIQEAIDACVTNEGGIVMLPQGQTIIDAGPETSPLIDMPGVDNGAGALVGTCALKGYGAGGDLNNSGGLDVGGSQIRVTNWDDMAVDASSERVVLQVVGEGTVLEGFTINASASPTGTGTGNAALTDIVLDVNLAHRSAIKDVKITDQRNLAAPTEEGVGIRMTDCLSCELIGVHVLHLARGIWIANGAGFTNNGTALLASSVKSGDVGVYIEGDAVANTNGCRNLGIFGGIIEGNSTTGIQFESDSLCHLGIYNVHFENTGADANIEINAAGASLRMIGGKCGDATNCIERTVAQTDTDDADTLISVDWRNSGRSGTNGTVVAMDPIFLGSETNLDVVYSALTPQTDDDVTWTGAHDFTSGSVTIDQFNGLFYTSAYTTGSSTDGLKEAMDACEAGGGGTVVLDQVIEYTVDNTDANTLLPELTICHMAGNSSQMQSSTIETIGPSKMIVTADAEDDDIGPLIQLNGNFIGMRDMAITYIPAAAPLGNAVCIEYGDNGTSLRTGMYLERVSCKTKVNGQSATAHGVGLRMAKVMKSEFIGGSFTGWDSSLHINSFMNNSIFQGMHFRQSDIGVNITCAGDPGTKFTFDTNIIEGNEVGIRVPESNCEIFLNDYGSHYEASLGTLANRKNLHISSADFVYSGFGVTFGGHVPLGMDIHRDGGGDPVIHGADSCTDCRFRQGATYQPSAAQTDARLRLTNVMSTSVWTQWFDSPSDNSFIWNGEYDWVSNTDCDGDMAAVGNFTRGAKCWQYTDDTVWECTDPEASTATCVDAFNTCSNPPAPCLQNTTATPDNICDVDGVTATSAALNFCDVAAEITAVDARAHTWTGAHTFDGLMSTGTQQTLGTGDLTPDVSAGVHWVSHATQGLITNFDGTPVDGQLLVVQSGGSDTDYDCTANTLLNCGSADILTDAGDVTTWVYDATTPTWNLIAYNDASTDMGTDGGGGSGAFSDAGDPVVLNTTTKEVHVGDGAGVLAGKMEIGGDADEPQLVIEGFSTQTNSIVVVQNDADTELMNIDNSGDVLMQSIQDIDGPGTNWAITSAGAVTAVSYGGITEANLVDKSAAETIAGVWALGAPTATSISVPSIISASNADIVIDANGTGETVIADSICDASGCASDWNVTAAGVAEFASVGDSTATQLWTIDAAGAATFASVTAAASATPGMDFIDSDTTDEDVSVAVDVNCTATGTGAEDCDFTLGVQEAGSAAASTPRIFVNADGPTHIEGDYVYIGDSTTPVTPGVANGENDLYVEADLEVDGVLNVGGIATFGSDVVLAANSIITADITDANVTEAKLDVTNAPGAGEDGYALTWNNAGSNMTWEAGGSGDITAVGSCTNGACFDGTGITPETLSVEKDFHIRLDEDADEATGTFSVLDSTDAVLLSVTEAGLFSAGANFSVNSAGLVSTLSNIELGHATANTLSASGGVLSVEGVAVLNTASTANDLAGVTTIINDSYCKGAPADGFDCDVVSIPGDDITDNTLDETELAADLAFADGDSLDLTGITLSATGEGLILTSPADCDAITGLTAGTVCYDTTDDALCVYDGAAMDCQTLGAGGGTLTGDGATTHVPYYTGTQVLGNEAAFNYTAGTNTLVAGNFSGDGSSLTSVDAATGDSATAFFDAGTLEVARGGTGAGTFTNGGILLGSGTGAITALGVATNGQIPIGDGTTDPVLAGITGTANEIVVTNGAGSITLDIPASAVLVTPVLGAASATSISVTSQTEVLKLQAGGANKLAAGTATIGSVDGTNFAYNAVQLQSAADETVSWEFDLPANFLASGAVTAVYKWTNDTGTTGTVCLGFQTAGFSDNDPFRGATLGAFAGATDTSTASDDIMVSPSVTLTETWTASEHVILTATRDVDGAGTGCTADAMAEDMHLLSVELSFKVGNVFSGEAP